jgi:diguanylate cyclase (GGDEF)-like protein
MRIKLSPFDSTVARRIFTAFLLASLLPVGVVAMLVLVQVRGTLEQQASVQLREAGRNNAQQLLDRMLAAESVLPYLAGATLDRQPVQFDAAAIRVQDGEQTIFGELNAPPELDVAEGASALMVRDGPLGSEVLLATRVQAGLVVARLNPSYLWHLSDAPFSMDYCVYQHGRLAALYCTADAPEAIRYDAAARLGASSDAGGARSGGADVLSSHWEVLFPTRFDGEPWSILVSQRRSVALGPLVPINRAFPQAIGLGLVLILIISLGQIKHVLRPLGQLVAGTKRIAERNFSTRFNFHSGDEFASLGLAMNHMAERLGSQFDTLTALAEIDRLILSSSDTEQIFDAVLERIARVVPKCDIGVLLIDPDKPDRGRLYRRSKQVEIEQELLRVPVAKELKVWLGQRPKGRMHTIDDVRRRLPEYPHQVRGGKVFVQPILYDDDLQGTLFACFDANADVSNTVLESLQEFAMRCAVAISSAEREQKLLHRAHFDALTGLPNRQLLHDRLTQALAVARRDEHKLAVLFIDLDGFKHVNDSLGHSCGDELLRETALRLRAALRDTDTVARLGGDEYVVVLPHVHGALEVEVIASNIMDAMKWPFSIDQQMAFVSLSVGVTIFPDDAQSVEDLLRKADTAMYSAKDAGRSRYVFFAKEMDVCAHERLALQTDLQSALTNGELFLAYQPQIDLASGEVVCAEALLRWKHPVRGMVPVEMFLPVLEETGLVESIGSWVLQTALAEFVRWKKQGLAIERVAVNTATRQLFDADLVDLVDECLHLSELPGSCLEIELTESSLVTDFMRSNNILKALAARDVRIAIDDFGTGYSSLGYLKDLTFDMVKIDRAFISGMPDEKSLAIVKAVLGMAQSLGKKVVAEGIESELQREQLAALGCDIGQGFLLGRPLPGPMFMQWLQSVETTNVIEQVFALKA